MEACILSCLSGPHHRALPRQNCTLPESFITLVIIALHDISAVLVFETLPASYHHKKRTTYGTAIIAIAKFQSEKDLLASLSFTRAVHNGTAS